jgi:hypothetical protein
LITKSDDSISIIDANTHCVIKNINNIHKKELGNNAILSCSGKYIATGAYDRCVNIIDI